MGGWGEEERGREGGRLWFSGLLSHGTSGVGFPAVFPTEDDVWIFALASALMNPGRITFSSPGFIFYWDGRAGREAESFLNSSEPLEPDHENRRTKS